MIQQFITIYGEQPEMVSNPSTCKAFRDAYPVLFAPLQTETFARIRSGRNLALVAPTSSGKTLAVAAPLFELRRKTVFVYPYRALVLDQTNQLLRYGEPFGLTKNDFAQVMGGRPERELANAIEKDYILMTPDKLVSLFASGRRTPQMAAQTILTKYAFVFDEIHTYNSLMLSSLIYFIRSVKYWREDGRGLPPAFYFLSATFPNELWLTLQQELSMEDTDRIEGISNTGNVSLYLRPRKNNPVEIARDAVDLGMTEDVVCIFNTALLAWHVAEAIWGAEIAKQRLFVGQDKMSEKQRVSNFQRFIANPAIGGLCGSPAIEAGVDFGAANSIIEETYADSFLQRFGRIARSGHDARVLCYSDSLYDAWQRGLLQSSYSRKDFLDVIRQLFPMREPRHLLTGLAAFPYFKFWDGPEFIEDNTLALCRKLDEKQVDHLLAFRGFMPYTHYETGESINYRTLFRKNLRLQKGKVIGPPGLEKYFFARRRPPVISELYRLAHFEKVDDQTTVLLAQIRFAGFDTTWTVLEYKSADYALLHPYEQDDNFSMRGLPQGEIGKVSEANRNGILKFYDVET